jgi:hypothetical protein
VLLKRARLEAVVQRLQCARAHTAEDIHLSISRCAPAKEISE